MKVLITGGSGLLAKYLYQTKPKEVELASTWYTNKMEHIEYHADITNESQLSYVLEVAKPDIIIHAAALGNVDFAEYHYREAKRVIVDGTNNILKWANGAKVVYISSNAVYNGSEPPYSESSSQYPTNNYGRLKKHAEEYMKGYAEDWLIIRPFLLYGWPHATNRTNWASLIVNSLRAGKSLKLVNDVVWQPTYAADCAQAIWKVLGQNKVSFNIASAQRMSLHSFGVRVARAFDLDATLLEAVPSSHFPQIAKRPLDTTYDTTAINQFFKIPDIEDGLRRLKEEEM